METAFSDGRGDRDSGSCVRGWSESVLCTVSQYSASASIVLTWAMRSDGRMRWVFNTVLVIGIVVTSQQAFVVVKLQIVWRVTKMTFEYETIWTKRQFLNPKYATPSYWLFWVEGLWKTAHPGRVLGLSLFFWRQNINFPWEWCPPCARKRNTFLSLETGSRSPEMNLYKQTTKITLVFP